MGQIIDLLLAAGYFRVRIKGLSSFDKVSLICLLSSLIGLSWVSVAYCVAFCKECLKS